MSKQDTTTNDINYCLLDLGRQIKARREELGISVRDFSAGAGISYAYLTNIENGKANPTLKEIMIISNGLGMNLEVKLIF